jgi:hypothetical protein
MPILKPFRWRAGHGTHSFNDHLSKIETCWNILRQAHGGSTQKREQARAWFVERHGPMVRRYLAKAVGAEAAVELTQEFAKRFLEGRSMPIRVEASASPVTLLCSTLDKTSSSWRHVCLFHLR